MCREEQGVGVILWAVRLQWHSQAMNALRRCATPGCKRNKVPTAVKSRGLVGGIFTSCVCDGVLWKVLCSKHIYSTWINLALHPNCIHCSRLYSCTVLYAKFWKATSATTQHAWNQGYTASPLPWPLAFCLNLVSRDNVSFCWTSSRNQASSSHLPRNMSTPAGSKFDFRSQRGCQPMSEKVHVPVS